MSFDATVAWDALPDLPPAADVETRRILRHCIAARVALEKLRVSGQYIPNQEILIRSIPMLEAQASSKIENIITTTDLMFRFAGKAEHKASPATKEALRYEAALHRGFEMLAYKPVSTAMAVEVCRVIKGVDLDIRKSTGTKLINDVTGQILYTPPEGEELLRSKLANWEHYIHEMKHLDPLIRFAVMHYQFEAIHPFIDGNGRSGRIIGLLYLVEQGLLDIPVLYFSAYILKNRSLYYQYLHEVTTNGAWEQWLLFMIEAVRNTAERTTHQIHRMKDLLDMTIDMMRQKAPKIYSRELAEILFLHPYCRVSDVVKAGIARRQTASLYLNSLATKGLVDKKRLGRENLYVNRSLLTLLVSEQQNSLKNTEGNMNLLKKDG